MRLSRAAISDLPAGIGRPSQPIGAGILHFGPGAFHRAHQGDFIDRLLCNDPRWGIVEVSLRSGDTTTALAAQDGLYTLAIRDAEPLVRVIGAVSEALGPEDTDRVLVRLADPAIRLVTSTVTEKGYCLGGDATLDFAHPDIVHDLGRSGPPRSVIGWLVAGLAARRDAGVAAFAVAPCDNLPDNGARIGAAVTALARAMDPELANWIECECRFAGTMVDAITPASDAELFERVRVATGFDDQAPVQREAFAQWVIEDVLPAGSPDLASVGAVLTSDVAGFERAKLRILNGAHSSLAYLGLLRGHASVSAAMGDAILARFIATMVIEDVLPAVPRLPGFDIDDYAAAVFTRFRNPAIVHRLTQIAIDGSQKLPYRLFDSVAAARKDGRRIDRLMLPIAAWMRWISRAPNASAIADPMATTLWAAAHDSDPVGSIMAIESLFPPTLRNDLVVREALLTGWRTTANIGDINRALAS